MSDLNNFDLVVIGNDRCRGFRHVHHRDGVECAPGFTTHAGAIAQYANCSIRAHHQRYQPRHARLALRSSYAAAKAALESLTPTMAIELASDGITANALAPGPTEAELFCANNPPGGEGEERYSKSMPMRKFAQPADIAAAIAFLAGEKAAFITGQTLFVDGGASLGRLQEAIGVYAVIKRLHSTSER